MKRHIIIIVLLAASLTGCRKGNTQDRDDRPSEMTFLATADTRGHVTGTVLTDDRTGYRPLYIAAYLHPQSGEDAPYLTGDRFEHDSGVWKRNPTAYWPAGGSAVSLDILAYSSNTPIPEKDITWGTPNNAERMRIRIWNDRHDDDILYGGAWGFRSTGTSASITMHHTQAWVEAVIKGDTTPEAPVTLLGVELNNAYQDGVLNIENNAGAPSHEWDFRQSKAAAVILGDPSGAYGSVIDATPRTLTLLIPEQPQTAIIVTYSCNGDTCHRRIDLTGATWQAGKHYTYEMTVSGADMTFSASLAPWGDVTDPQQKVIPIE